MRSWVKNGIHDFQKDLESAALKANSSSEEEDSTNGTSSAISEQISGPKLINPNETGESEFTENVMTITEESQSDVEMTDLSSGSQQSQRSSLTKNNNESSSLVPIQFGNKKGRKRPA